GKGGVVGSFRLTLMRDWPFIGHEVYGFETLASIVSFTSTDSVARVDRCVIAKTHRGSGLLRMLQNFTEAAASSMGVEILVGVPGFGNPRSRAAFSKVGWLEYPVVAAYRNFTAQLIYKDIRAIDHHSLSTSGAESC